MRLSVIIVSYNVKVYLEQSLRSVQRSLARIPSEIIVIDNGSGDGSVAMVRSRFPHVRIIANKNNEGFAKACNQGLRRALGEYIALVNPDTLIEKDTFKTCLDCIEEEPEIGAVGCKILNPDGTLQLSCRRGFPDPWSAFTKVVGLSALFPKSRLFGRYNLTYLDAEEVVDVDALSGAFMLIRREILSDVGLLDEEFFLYGEDLDWCYRIRKHGWRIRYCPEAHILHYKGQSAREAPFDNLRYFYLAMHRFVWKHYGNQRALGWFLTAGIWLRGAISFCGRLLARTWTVLLDIVFLQASLILAIGMRFGDLQYWSHYRPVNVVYTLIWIACLYAMGSYHRKKFDGLHAVGGAFLGLVLNTSLTFFLPQVAFSRQVILVASVCNALFLGGWRVLLGRLHRVRIPGISNGSRFWNRKRVLIIGMDDSGDQWIDQQKDRQDVEVVGRLALRDQELLRPESDPLLLGTIQDLKRIAAAHRIHAIVFTPRAAQVRWLHHAIGICRELHVDCKLIPSQKEMVIGRVSMTHPGDDPLLDLNYRLWTEPNPVVKRILDLSLAILLLPLFLILIGIATLHAGSKWRTETVSDGFGQPLRIRSIRSDRKNRNWGSRLPCIFQILHGTMSWVGSPLLPFQEGQPGRGYKPGLTGLVQINGGRQLSAEVQEQYDLLYMKEYSLFWDIQLLLLRLHNS